MSFKVSAKYKNNKIHLNFGKGVVSTGGTISILGKKNKELESISLGSNKISGGIYSLKTSVHDYPYNWIALDNDEIFGTLAKHNSKKLGDETSEDWAFDLRTFWNVSIGGKFYRLDQSTIYKTSSDDYYNYHSTTPEYTEGYDESGFKDIVLTPLGGIKSLKIKLNKKKIKPGDYKVDISGAGLRPATGEDLNLNEKISDTEEFKVAGKSKKNKEPKTSGSNFFTKVDDLLNALQGRKFADFAANDEVTGTYKVEKLNKGKITHRTKVFFNGKYISPIMQGLGIDGLTYNNLTTTKETKGDITPFGNALKKGRKFHYYSGKDKVASLTLLGSNLKTQVNEFKKNNYSGAFNLNLVDNHIDFYNGKNKKEPWMSATFVDDLF